MVNSLKRILIFVFTITILAMEKVFEDFKKATTVLLSSDAVRSGDAAAGRSEDAKTLGKCKIKIQIVFKLL